jgi:plasmid stabilization system protein ParE
VKPLTYHPSAQSEVDSAHDRYLRHSIQAGDGFYEELLPALDRIQDHPNLCSRFLFGTQRLVLSRYPYSVVFRERLHGIQIIAVAHAKRRPGYWTKRLKQ